MHKSTSTQKGGYNREVEWWLTEVARLHGEKSNHAGVVAAIERGINGGCKGTKGCGIIRVEPFENDGRLRAGFEGGRSIHGDFARARACEAAWRALRLPTQWILAARYCYTRNNLPPGILGQLGDLAVVAIVVVAIRDAQNEGVEGYRSQFARLMEGTRSKAGNRWAEELAARELTLAHAEWAGVRWRTEGVEI